MAVERVEQLLIDVTNALTDAGAPFAVIGGNAVATWVSTIDPARFAPPETSICW